MISSRSASSCLSAALLRASSPLIAVSGSVIGALFFVQSLSKKRGLADYLAGPIAIACPLVYFAIYFTTLGYGVGVAFAVSCLGVYLLKTSTWLNSIMAIACFTLGIGIYQAVLPLIATLFCLQLVASVIEESNLTFTSVARRILFFILVTGCAAVSNQAISEMVMHWQHATFDAAYITGFIHFETTADYFITTLHRTITTGWAFYTGSKEYYLFDLSLLKILFLLTLVVSFYRVITASCSWLVRLFGVLALMGAIIAPIMMHMLNAGYMPPRTVLGISYVMAGLIFFTASSTSQFLRIITTVLVIACFYNFSMINNRYAFSNQMSWLADRELSVQILNKVHDALNKLPVKTDPYKQLPLEIVGWHEYFETPIFVHREVIGASFYTWGAGDADRITRLFASMGVTDFRPASKQEKLSVVEGAKQMPSWPYTGSVDVINDIIVVKLRDYNPNQLMWMCEAPDENNPVCLKYAPKN